jgi:hypothetical protein
MAQISQEIDLTGGRQKQVDRAIARAFAREPGRGKCRAHIDDTGTWLVFYHYTHRLLVWELARRRAIDTWWERTTDLRILRAAIANLRLRM